MADTSRQAVRTGPFRRRLLANTAASGASNVWAMAVAFGSIPLFASALGVSGLGAWALLQTLSATTGWLSIPSSGLSVATSTAVAARRSVGDEDEAGAILGTSLAMMLALGVFSGAILAVIGANVLPAAFGLEDELATQFTVAVRIMALQVVAEMLLIGVQAGLEGEQRVDVARALDALRRTLAIALALVGAASGGLVGAATGMAVGTWLALAISIWGVRRRCNRLGAPNQDTARQLLRYCGSVSLAGGAGVVHRAMDRTIVGIALGPSAVALVEVATQLQNGVLSLMAAASTSLVPSASHLDARGDRHLLRDLLLQGSRFLDLLILPAAVMLAALAPAVIDVWLGDEFAGAAPLVVLGAGYLLLVSPLQVGSSILIGVGQASKMGRRYAVVVALNLVLSLALVGPLGVAGPFLATVLATAVLIPTLGGLALDLCGTTWTTFARMSIMRPAVVAGAAGLAAWPCGWLIGGAEGLVLGLLLGGVTAALVGLRFAATPKEIRQLLAGRTGDGSQATATSPPGVPISSR